MRLRARARHPRSARRPPDSAPRRRARNETRLRVAAPSGPVNRRLLGELHVHVPLSRSAAVVDDANEVHARGSGRHGNAPSLTGARRSTRGRRTRTRAGHRRRDARVERDPVLRRRRRRAYVTLRSGEAMRGGSIRSSVAQAGSGGGVRRGMPASRNSFSMSDDQNSNTSNRVAAAYGGQPGRPVCVSIATARCSWLTRIGDLPGMYHVSTVRGQSAFGRSPLRLHTATC